VGAPNPPGAGAPVPAGGLAAHAELLLCAPAFSTELEAGARGRVDVELVDLERLYTGE